MTRTRLDRRGRHRAALAVLVAGLLVAPLAPAASAADADVRLAAATSGNTAVRFQQPVSVSGTVPAGPLTAARLLGLAADGARLGAQRVDGSVLGAPAPTPLSPVTGSNDYLRVDGDQLSGRLTLGCLFSAPNPTCSARAADAVGDVRLLRLEVTVGDVVALSGPLRVDYDRPTLRDAELVSEREVRVFFTEPVRYPATQPEALAGPDWEVSVGGQPVPVTDVGGPAPDDCVGRYGPGEDASAGPTGCSRLLRLAAPVDEDATPSVEYVLFDNRVPDRMAYEDFASNRSLVIGFGAFPAIDRIRPPLPRIESVDDAVAVEAGKQAGREPAPVVRVSGVREGHSAWIQRTTSDGTVLRGPEVTVVPGAPVQTALTAPRIDVDGEHVLTAVVRDPTGNLSTDSGRNRPVLRPDQSPSSVTYVLDRVAPFVVAAVAEGNDVVVTLSEPVTGPERSADWKIRTAPGADYQDATTISGSGATRRLTFASPTAGRLLSYLVGPADERYVDRVRNPLPNTVDVPVGGVGIPVLTSPAGPVVTSATTFALRGEGQPGDVVELFRESEPGMVLSRTTISGVGDWSLTAPLRLDTVNDDLRVRAVRPDFPSSAAVPVPGITQDGTAPTLTLTRPAGGERLTAGSRSSAAYSTDDRNPGTVSVELTTDGSTWQPLASTTATNGTTEVPFDVPQVDSDRAQVRVTTVDQAGNSSGAKASPLFSIDGLSPFFDALTTATDRIEVTFSEPVSGPTGRWQVDGRDALVVSADGSSTPPLSLSEARSLVLRPALPLGEDEEPDVAYAPLPLGGQLLDASTPGNVIAPADRVIVAVDGIRPAVPTITAVDGRTPQNGRVLSGAIAPQVSVENLVAGQFVRVERVPATGLPVAGREVETQGSSALVSAPRLPDDGEHVLRVVVRDATGNTSADTAKNPGRDDGGPASVTYVLDRTVPVDTTLPELALRAPAAGALLAGGSPSTVEYTTSDDQPGRLDLEVSTDGGATYALLGTVTDPANGDGSFRYTVPDVDTVRARVRATAVDTSGNRTQVVSGLFTIDALAPTFVAVTTAPRTVVLTFSEPVSGRVSPFTDFRVDGQPATVTSIEGSPSTTASGARTFVLTVPAGVGEDANPVVTYAPSPLGELVDRAQQAVVERTVTAVDGIRPAVPTVTAVDGRAPQDGRVLGGNVAPQVSVGNLVAGQFVRVERVPAAGLPVAGPEVQTQNGSLLVPGPRLPDDGEHVLRVVVRDATGNTSNDTAKNPGRDDRGPASVVYELDTDLPAILFAVADGDEILVRFTEALFPAGGNAADWRVTRPDGSPVPLGDGSVTVVAVRGAGDTRVLQVTGVQAGSLLVYSPAGERYTDANANPLPDTTTPLLALAPPVVTTPASAVLVTADRTTVAGTAEPGSTVSLFRRGSDGAPAGAAATSARAGDDGRWSFTALLELDRDNDFLVQARRTDGRDTIAVPVPTISQDSVAPVLAVDGLPGDQEPLAPGSARTLSWSVCDANLGPTPMVLEFSADDGATWTRLGPARLASPNDCDASTSRRVTLPGTGETTSARLRVSAVDLAGRTTRVVSPRFVLAGATVVRDVRGYACPPEQVQPAGFTDTATSTFRFEIDCLAAYEFTKGVTADRYEPLGNVTRAQMALFVARVAAYAGVPLDTSDAGFTDVGDRSQETRDAINALANLDVVQGVGGGRYAPADPVSRGQMASFLARVQQQVGTPFPAARDAFRDDDGTTHETNVDLIAGAGIVQGTTPGTYEPLAAITRQQMAGFLIRYVDSQVEAGEVLSAYE